MTLHKDFEWFKHKTVYQIWPRSFCDSNGDGIGDIQGIISKLPYLEQLGIEVIWLSPVYKSPMDDMGYDIADYFNIDPLFGSNADMDELIATAKAWNISIVMDLVVNHTSDEHPWFIEARKGRDNPYRDYYIWHDPVDGGTPTTQRSFFLPSAWSLDSVSGQYYYHAFSNRQPDLNWENPQILEEVYKIMNFWLAKGIAGFRMDVIELIGKIPLESKFTSPRVHELLKLIFKHTLANYEQTISVGETGGASVADAILYSGNHDELDMVFGFEHMAQDEVTGKSKWHLEPLHLPDFKRVFKKWQNGLYQKGWNSLFLANHDQPRPVSRWGCDGKYRIQSAKMLANTLHFMQGTPYIYQGEEIGMTNYQFTSIDEFRDIEMINFYQEYINDAAWGKDRVMQSINAKGRDNARTPVQWTDGDYAGFSAVKPWIVLNSNYKQINVANDLNNPDSIWHFYQKLIKLRKELAIILHGDFNLLDEDNLYIFAYVRSYQEQKLYVISNFSAQMQSYVLDFKSKKYCLLTSNYQRELLPLDGVFELQPFETLAFLLD
ncbi:MAG TPA: alpha-glucosidase [Burkholderiales bacterium]|nr:alpha-glucosidase [Burkholderiales bacterium]